jgi:hypothetical protein
MPTSPNEPSREGVGLLSKIWADPVWSKVIAAAIIGAFTLVVGRHYFPRSDSGGPSDQKDVRAVAPPSSPAGTSTSPSGGTSSPPSPVVPAPAAPSPAPRASRFVNQGAFNPDAAAVLLWNRDTKRVSRLSENLVALLQGFGGLFTDAFVESGRFARAMGGDVAALTEAGITERAASLIVLGTHAITITQHEPVAGMRTYKAVASASIRVFRPGAGFRSETFVEEATAPGMEAGDAETAAGHELVERIARRLAR